MCDLYSALSLWYFPVCITSRILYHRLFASEIAFLKNGQKKTSKSFGGVGGLIPSILYSLLLLIERILNYSHF